MAKINKGVLTAKTDKASDEVYTPEYAIKPLLKYIQKDTIIWCPFDKEWSKYVEIFTDNGYKVIYSHIDNGQDFFSYEPTEPYDVIISNPPYSQKDEVLKRLHELGKPYAMLLPIATLQGKSRFPYLKEDCQYLGFDKRINFYMDKEMTAIQKGIAFGTRYICKKFLPKDLIIEELEV